MFFCLSGAKPRRLSKSSSSSSKMMTGKVKRSVSRVGIIESMRCFLEVPAFFFVLLML
jgi:hypothetical protein